MRYYKITITDPKGQPAIFPSLNGSGMPPGVITSLLPDGSFNPAALNIEFDLVVYPGHIGGGSDTSSYVRIWGLSLKELSHAFNLANYNLTLEGGMSKGLPLANPNQRGLLIRGTINQAIGNWVGTDQTLDMFLRAPDTGSDATPVNYNFNSQSSQPLSDSITQALKTALPNAKLDVNISAQRIAPQQQQGYYSSFAQFAQMILGLTKGKLNAGDQGVQMTYDGQTVRVYEGSPTEASGSVKQIAFQDIIGQITWNQPLTAQAKLVLRGDLDVDDIVQFPQGVLAQTSAGAAPAFGGTSSNPSNDLTFGGNTKYQIMQQQHWGNFRQPDVSSWVTSIWCTAAPQQQQTAAAPGTSPAPLTTGPK